MNSCTIQQAKMGDQQQQGDAEGAKLQGNDHFRAGEFREAIASFSRAIELDPNNHVYFSNRSAAYLGQGNTSKALEDASLCIGLKNDWPKGYSRKGAALMAKKNYALAIATYRKGLAYESSNESLKQGLAEAEMLDSTTRNSGSSVEPPTAQPAQPAQPSAASRTSDSAPSLRTFVWGDAAAKFRSAQFIIRSFMMLNAVRIPNCFSYACLVFY
jgi:stress-induced-phosphoprotein 1